MTKDDEVDPRMPREGSVITPELSQKRYRVLKLLGRGGYGAVFEVERQDDKERFAMKCESIAARKQVLAQELGVITQAEKMNLSRFCTRLDQGFVLDRFSFIVMTLMGLNLWDARMKLEHRCFSLCTSLQMAQQTLFCIEQVHRLGFLHRDIKPGNFILGLGALSSTVFVLDFGLTRAYTDGKEELRPLRIHAPYRGTTRYASLAALREEEQTRKDDLESWLYIILEWTSGNLPWRHEKNRRKHEVIRQKVEIRRDKAAADKIFYYCPDYFRDIMNYLDQLTETDVPDYEYLNNVLTDCFLLYGLDPQSPLDWSPKTSFHPPEETIGDGRPSCAVRAPGDWHTVHVQFTLTDQEMHDSDHA